MNIFYDLARGIERLTNTPAIEVLFQKVDLVDDAKAERVRRTLSSVFDLDVAPAVQESVRIADNFYVYWKKKNASDGDAVFGEFYLNTVLLFGLENELDPTFKSKKYGDIDLDDTRVFDHYKFNGGPIYSLLPLRDGHLEDKVLVFNEKSLFSTTLTYSTYLEQLRRTRGALFWQYLFCEDAKVEPYEVDALARGIDFVAKTFPGDDYEELQQRLKSLRTRLR
jgi:hypothetical protein